MRSDAVKKGMQTAPQRSLFNALGITEEELEKPFVFWDERTDCCTSQLLHAFDHICKDI